MTFELGNLSKDQIFAVIERDMEALEQSLGACLRTEHPYFTELNAYVLSSPGKRLRPALLFLACKMLACDGPAAISYGTVYELIHTATLIHDDVIDAAEKRRGRISLNQTKGNTVSVLYGDLLYTKANSLAVDAGSLSVLKLICDVTQRMIEGELLQERWNYDLEITERDYFEILISKTARLFAAAVTTAGHVGGLDASDLSRLHDYGYHLGVSFQLIDDYLDYAGTEDQMGKPVLSDLKDGKVTLPIIRLLARDRSQIEPLIRIYWESGDRDAVERIQAAVNREATLRETWLLGRDYAEKAVAFLADFPDNMYRDILLQIPRFMLHRVK